jgi:EmrB/QacA subfamily drug resistance transporter
MSSAPESASATQESGQAPANPRLVLGTLILVAAVANLNLSVANVALPDIATALSATQTQLDMIAVGFSLGLASSVLWLGALGDRYGRKMMLILGMCLSIPMGLLAAWAPSVGVLVAARIVGGFAAGMAFPTTLALITAMWSGPGRTRSIALWSAIGGALSALGPLVSGALQEKFWWGSVFLVTVPLAVIALPLVLKAVPAHVGESDEPVDNLGGILSMLFVGALVVAINFSAEPDARTGVYICTAIFIAALIAFVLRQRTAENPLYDLKVAARRTFWVAALAGLVVFGTLMGAVFIGQQYLQNVLAYSPFESGAAILPAALFMVVAAPRSAKLVHSIGSRHTLLIGYVACFLGIISMLFLWTTDASYLQVAVAYCFIGAGVGLAGTPASNSLTGSVPVSRAGMASGTADLQRDLGGAIMQSMLGAFLAAGYASALAAQIAALPESTQQQIPASLQSEVEGSFSVAQVAAEKYPDHSDQIIAAARQSFVDGQDQAYYAALAAIVLGAALVFFRFPKKERELEMLDEFHRVDGTDQSEVGAEKNSPA